MGGLAGQVALITGASRGIGAATALLLAEHGAKLVLGYLRNEAQMAQVVAGCRERGAEVVTAGGDLSDPQTAIALRDRALATYGALDLLVNNAGFTAEGLLALAEDEEIARTIGTNIAGLTYMTQAALEPMLRQRRGCIINLSSVLASRPGRGNAVYAGSKGFVEAFTRAVAVEVARKNIRVNAIAPGVIETEMTRAVRALAGKKLIERIPAGRLGRPEEVAELVALLAGGQLDYVNGAVLALDGGFVGGS